MVEEYRRVFANRRQIRTNYFIRRWCRSFSNNETIWFYPRVSTIISDWLEAASFCLVYKSPNLTFPCHFCLVKKDDLANINLSFNDVVPRTHNEMRRYLENNTPNSASIESVPNFFWNLP